MKCDDVGVVVIGRNEGRRLVDCLNSIKAVTDNIIYVDSGSSDNSVGIAERIGATVVRLDMSRSFTAARARNEGFSALKSLLRDVRFVQFIDGDCILVPNWLPRATVFLKEHVDVAVVCGRRRERFPAASIYNRLCDLEWDTPVGEAMACGGDSLVRTSAFEEAGGYLSRVMAGEEPELCIRLREGGWKIWRLDAEMTLHDAAMTKFSQWWLRAVRSGYGFAEVTRLHRNSKSRLWPRAIPSALFWAACLPASIVLAAIVHPMFLCGILIYPLQAWRIAGRAGGSENAWAYAGLILASKFAQAQGILKYYWLSWHRQDAQLIEYKNG